MNALIGGLTQFFIPSHLLAIVALALLAAQHAERFPALMLTLLAAGLLAGSLTVASAIRENPAALALLALAAIAAALVVVARALPSWIGAVLAFAMGVALPLNSPPHAIRISDAIVSQLGFAVAAVASFAFVAIVATRARRPWQRIGTRVVGSWIAASAILVLALRLVR
jgi:urease accessory protein